MHGHRIRVDSWLREYLLIPRERDGFGIDFPLQMLIAISDNASLIAPPREHETHASA
jgi:hypothetical protein